MSSYEQTSHLFMIIFQNVQMLETELAAAKNLVLKMESQLKIEIQQREDYKKQCEDLKRKLKEVQDELANTQRQLEEARRIIEQYKKVLPIFQGISLGVSFSGYFFRGFIFWVFLGSSGI